MIAKMQDEHLSEKREKQNTTKTKRKKKEEKGNIVDLSL